MSAEPHPSGRADAWQGRPFTARALRFCVFSAPILSAIMLTRLVVMTLPSPMSVAEKAGWWVLIVTCSVCTGAVVDRWSRRLLPVAALMKLSLVFPDEAPSRFRVALRRESVRDLERRLRDDALDPTTTPNDAAEILVEMAAQLNGHDRNTRGHTERVRAYSLMIGEELGLSRSQLNKLHWAALVHDVGKLRVPKEILAKAGAPSDEEWEILKRHPEWGEEMVRPLRPWLGNFADAAGQHHERWDGSGYPQGLKGNQITLAARIVAVADAYDVMTSVRSYKQAMDPTDARLELTRCSGTQFDPRCSRALISASLGASAKTKKGIVWAIRAPILTLTARSNLFSTAGTTGAAVAATAAVVAVTVPPVTSEPLPFLDEPAVVEFSAAPDRLVVFAGSSADVDVAVNDQTADGRFGSPQLEAELVAEVGADDPLRVTANGSVLTVEAPGDDVATHELSVEVCASSDHCRVSGLEVLVVEPGARWPILLVPAVRVPVGERFGPESVIAHRGGPAVESIEVEVSAPGFFTDTPRIDPDGRLTFVAGPTPGLVYLTLQVTTADGAADPIQLPILVEPP